METISNGDVVTLKSAENLKMTVTDLLVNNRLQATYWNSVKGEFQTITGNRGAFQKVND